MGYLDLQVNGYSGVDFNADQLSTASVACACQRLRADGVDGILATVITDDVDAMCRRLANIHRCWEEDRWIRTMIWGVHIEGPFLNEQQGYIGAHPADAACSANVEDTKRLLEAAGGLTRIVTLAPERDHDARVTELLVAQGICVSAGHCNPTEDQLRRSIDAGLSMFTHLGNGCPLTIPRHDNIIQRALSMSDRLYFGFIADGVHIPFMALRNYLKCCGLERAFVVTDAIAAAGLGSGEYELRNQRVVVDAQLATWSADRSHLMGSAGTMPRSADNLRNFLGFDDDQISQLLEINPRIAGGLPKEHEG